jgi:DNA mismatch repair protein MutL
LGISQKTADIVQLHKTYLVTQTKQGVLIIDQHAAHERILFEKYRKEFKNRASSRELKHPIALDLTPAEKLELTEQQASLLSLGFSVVQDNNYRYSITSAPMLLHDRNLAVVVKEIVSDLISGIPVAGIDTKSNKMLAYLACRTAVKAGDVLTKQQAKDILRELEGIPDAYTCPHGRPVKFELPLSELHKMFRRIT